MSQLIKLDDSSSSFVGNWLEKVCVLSFLSMFLSFVFITFRLRHLFIYFFMKIVHYSTTNEINSKEYELQSILV